jgi:hypothetical protein
MDDMTAAWRRSSRASTRPWQDRRMRSTWALALITGAAVSACVIYDEDDEPPTAQVCVWNGQTYQLGQVFPAGDGCNNCSCEPEGVACTLIACEVPDAGPVVDAAPASECAPTGICVDGPRCGDVCCDVGEACIGGVCSCGGGPACSPGDMCVSGVPTEPGDCGSVCCGANSPCPP